MHFVKHDSTYLRDSAAGCCMNLGYGTITCCSILPENLWENKTHDSQTILAGGFGSIIWL